MPKKNEKFSNGSWPPHNRYVYQVDDTAYPNTWWSYPFLLAFCNHRNTVTVRCETQDKEERCEYEYDVCDYCGKIMDYRKIEN